MTTVEQLDHFIEVQLQAWIRKDDKDKNFTAGPVIAITRSAGCDAETVAGALAGEFGLVVHDCEVVEQIARDANVSEQVVATLDTKVRPELDDWLAGFAGGSHLSSYHYMQCLRKVLFTIASHGKAVIMGRGSNFLLPPEKKTLGLCLVAPLELRISHTMKSLGKSRADALKHIDKTEHDQLSWVKEFCHADINDAAHYHVVINTALIKTDTIVQIVRDIIKAKT